MIVDFPQPLGPTNATFSPWFTLKDTFFRTTFSLEGYLKLTFLNSITPSTSPFLISSPFY